VTLVASGAAAAEDHGKKGTPPASRDAGQCVKRARDDTRTCVRTATEQCRLHFETDVQNCFHSDAECAKKCIAEQKTCRTSPNADDEGCRLACSSDLKVDLEQCRKKADLHGCEGPVRVKAFKCKQQCTANAQPKVQECLGNFDDCLGMCIRATGAH
jgi:hypothetical protein